MIQPCVSLLLVVSVGIKSPDVIGLLTKGLVSSLLRSLFSGQVAIFQSNNSPLFKVERKALEEIFVSVAGSGKSDSAQRQATREFMFDLCNFVKPEPRQWVIITHGGSLAMRNIDHLIAPDLSGPYAPTELDFYWARSGTDEITNKTATPGLWAVRGEHLPIVLERLKAAWIREAEGSASSEEEIWTRVVQDLPLRKRAFEKGEVVAPRIGAVDWEAVSNAAFVTVPDWPEEEAWKFLQALYFGTYLGDETGMMLNILEA